MPFFVLVGRPETRGVRGQRFVDEVQGAGGVDTEFELGVGDDDAAALGVGAGFFVEADGGDAGFVGELGAVLAGAGQRFGEVGAAMGLGDRGRRRFRHGRRRQPLVAGVKIGDGQLSGHLEARRQGDAADGAGLLVVLPAGTDDVATDDGFDGQRLEALDDDGAATDLFALVFGDDGFRIDAGQLIRDDVAELGETRNWRRLAGLRPLRGIGSGRMTSNADRRSVVTISSLSASTA